MKRKASSELPSNRRKRRCVSTTSQPPTIISSSSRRNSEIDEDYIPFYEPPIVYKKRRKKSNYPAVYKSFNSGFKKCYDLLIRMMNQEDSYFFNEPVDAIRFGVPTYYNIIKMPMDFGTIENKIVNKEYYNILEYASDVRLVFKNCFIFNKPKTQVFNAGRKLEKIFNNSWKKILTNENVYQIPFLKRGRSRSGHHHHHHHHHHHKKKKKKKSHHSHHSNNIFHSIYQGYSIHELGIRLNKREKTELINEISRLSHDQLGILIEIYKECEKVNKKIYKKRPFEINFNDLRHETLDIMRFYVFEYINNHANNSDVNRMMNKNVLPVPPMNVLLNNNEILKPLPSPLPSPLQ